MHPKFIRVAGQLYRKAEDLQAVENSLNAVLSAKSVLKGLGLDFSELDAAAAKLKSGKPAPTQKTSAVAVAPEYIRVAGRVYKRAEPSDPFANYKSEPPPKMKDEMSDEEKKAHDDELFGALGENKKPATTASVAPEYIRVAGKLFKRAYAFGEQDKALVRELKTLVGAGSSLVKAENQFMALNRAIPETWSMIKGDPRAKLLEISNSLINCVARANGALSALYSQGLDD
jgi:hypothetical protein